MCSVTKKKKKKNMQRLKIGLNYIKSRYFYKCYSCHLTWTTIAFFFISPHY